jgi:hypothetical protein
MPSLIGNKPNQVPSNGDLGVIAFKDAVGVADMNATGTPSNTTFLRGDNAWEALPIASTAEAEAGTNNTNFITPLRMREGFNASGSAPVYACRAWVNFDGVGGASIRASGNVSSVARNGTGDYTVNFTTAMPDANFSIVCDCGVADGTLRKTITSINRNNGTGAEVAPTTTSVRVTSGDDANADRDVKYFNLSVFR